LKADGSYRVVVSLGQPLKGKLRSSLPEKLDGKRNSTIYEDDLANDRLLLNRKYCIYEVIQIRNDRRNAA